MSEKPAPTVEHQFLGGQPAHTLDETTFDLADIDGGIERPADIVKDVDAIHPHLSGHRIDGHLRARRSVGKIEKRPAGDGVAVPIELRRRIETG